MAKYLYVFVLHVYNIFKFFQPTFSFFPQMEIHWWAILLASFMTEPNPKLKKFHVTEITVIESRGIAKNKLLCSCLNFPSFCCLFLVAFGEII